MQPFLPTTFAQQYMVTNPQATDHLSLPMRICSPLNLLALHTALQALVDRHEALRTLFAWQAGALVRRKPKPRTSRKGAPLRASCIT
mgnify:CR=1 FL=1